MYLDGTRKVEAGLEAKDEEKQKVLWAVSVKLAGIKTGDILLEDYQ